ncbi:MAG: TRAP transporter large permease subunit, partial [Burkholderiaceae bacterium]
MADLNVTVVVLTLLVAMVFAGMHIAVALGITSLIGIYLVTESLDIVINALGSVAFEGLRGYIFIALPLFMLMGEFISRSGAAQDLYAGINQLLRRIPGRLALSTIQGNAVLAFMNC